MFGIFKKKSELDKLQDKYKNLMDESYRLSHSDRKASDLKRAEAELIGNQIEKLQQSS